MKDIKIQGILKPENIVSPGRKTNALITAKTEGNFSPRSSFKTIKTHLKPTKENSLYQYLSHHYVQKRSIVIIVDTDYESSVYKDKAFRYVDYCFKKLNPTDSFGLISIGKYATDNDIELEEKSLNTYIKKILIKSLQDEENYLID